MLMLITSVPLATSQLIPVTIQVEVLVPSTEMTRIGMMLTPCAMPATRRPLFVAYVIVPATWLPCPRKSDVSALSSTTFQPGTKLTPCRSDAV